jgi:homoaconitate hydratase
VSFVVVVVIIIIIIVVVPMQRICFHSAPSHFKRGAHRGRIVAVFTQMIPCHYQQQTRWKHMGKDMKKKREKSPPAQNVIEKIVQRFVCGNNGTRCVKSGDYISVKPLHCMTHDNTFAVLSKFKTLFQLSAEERLQERIANNRQLVFTLDHNIQDHSESNLKKYRSIEEFAKSHGVSFFPAGRGIGHQIMCEEGFAWPLTMVVASDSHSNMYGGLGCLGTSIVRTDAAVIWATGETWWMIPPVTRVYLSGQLNSNVSGKDVIIALCGVFNKDQVLNHAIEFAGEGIKSLSIDDRLTIANMTTEWGALAGVFPVDEKTLEWLQAQHQKKKSNDRFSLERIDQLDRERFEIGVADTGANYAQELHLDLSRIRPYISGPNHVKVRQTIYEMEQRKVKINKAYIVSCTNSRVSDLASAAQAIKTVSKELNRTTIHPDVKLYISAASSDVQQESQLRGDWETLVNAGAQVLPPGCGPCIGLGTGLLEDGEVGISASNRNFKGRMGSRNAEAYLSSPAIVAASAMRGYISGPILSSQEKPNINNILLAISVRNAKNDSNLNSKEKRKVSLVKGFPSKISGTILFCHQDNLNTDGIYPGKYTYIELSPEEQAKVVMENYDPKFKEVAQTGHILIGGFNFGTGSSREQAATALKYKGIPLVIAGSFSEIFKRNAINNGFLTIESPELVQLLREKVGTQQLTQVLNDITVEVNFENSVLTESKWGNKFSISPIGPIAQELILTGGLENWAKNKLKF